MDSSKLDPCLTTNTYFLGPTRLGPKTASRSVKPFFLTPLQSLLQLFFNGAGRTTQKLPLPWEFAPPSNTRFVGPTQINTQTASTDHATPLALRCGL